MSANGRHAARSLAYTLALLNTSHRVLMLKKDAYARMKVRRALAKAGRKAARKGR